MADYFSEYSSFAAAKGIPSPADTPYDTPAFVRSKRSSRATTTGSQSRNQSESPPPLPPDAADVAERPRDGRYIALDPRRFTPTLHASLVSEILSLRRELDSKNHLVENLESGLAVVKNENDILSEKLASSAKEVRVARAQVQQMETGTYEALESIADERTSAQAQAEELRVKLEAAQKKMKLQDDDAQRTQSIWDREKESWENERRQLERRVHVTETRLRKFVDEMVSQRPNQHEPPQTVPAEEVEDESMFKDSGLGHESDSASIVTEPIKHRRGTSTASFKSSRSRYSIRDSPARMLQTPEPNAKGLGMSLADELGDDEDDDYDAEDGRSDDDLDYHDSVRGAMESRQSNYNGDNESKAMRILGIDHVPSSPVKQEHFQRAVENEAQTQSSAVAASSPQRASFTDDLKPMTRRNADGVEILSSLQEVSGSELDAESMRPVSRRVEYVDTGYQPSPPPSPVLEAIKPREADRPSIGVTQTDDNTAAALPISTDRQLTNDRSVQVAGLPLPATSIAQERHYTDQSTQTEVEELRVVPPRERDSLKVPSAVPAIAIHPPTSRPASPRPYALPPGTKNASTQAGPSSSYADASMQTEEIRVDARMLKLPRHLRPSYLFTVAPEPVRPLSEAESEAGHGVATILSTKLVSPTSSTHALTAQSPVDSMGVELSRDNSSKDLRSMPLKAIALPKPTLAPAITLSDGYSARSQGPLNRSSQFGVSHNNRSSRMLANMDNDSDASDTEPSREFALRDTSAAQRSGRFVPVEHPRNVPEDKELSPERRAAGAESPNGAAPAPSIASSRENKEQAQRARKRPPPKINTYASLRSRSPSFVSASDSNFSLPTNMPYPIPMRSSSRQLPPAFSDELYSPTYDPYVTQGRSSGSQIRRQRSLRKVQSSTSIRQGKVRVSPRKQRRRVRSPDLTPVQSMAFDSPAPTKFPIPELPTPLQRGPGSDYQWDVKTPGTAASSIPPADEHGLIDAIAGTMVGEWMWKYIRKRKSFGVGESAEDFTQIGEDGVVDIPGIGTRHKRWVWLSPYERTIMWDSKQPTTGSALLGKKGRKLMIQAVIDVKDDTPLPKKPELEHAYHRSILVLTPSRALKFTATTAERHRLWMNALSFLAESTRQQMTLPPVNPAPPAPRRAPPPPPIPNRTRNVSPSFGRATVRDSVRLTKNRDGNARQLTSAADSYSVGSEIEALKNEGADFPSIPRLYSSTARHQRKRSNTSPRLGPALNNLRSFSANGASGASSSHNAGAVVNNFSHIRPNAGPSSKVPSSSRSGSRSASVASPEPHLAPNIFEATGTVRMEAFVDPNVKNGVLYLPAPPTSVQAQDHAAVRRRRGDSNLSATTVDKRRAGYVFDDNGVDPFKGF